jgi:single-strand DNA-binding protein
MIMSGLARIGRDAELKYTTNNMAVCNVALAFTIGFGDRKTTTWVEVAIWGKQAEGLAKHLVKGSAIVAHLKDLKIEEYKKRDGTNGAKLTATLVDMEFAGSKPEGAAQDQPRQAQPPQKFEDFEDFDVPF